MRPAAALQVLGRVLPKTPLKSTKVVPQFKEATEQRPQDADLWELLGDLLSSLEPAGARRGSAGRVCRSAPLPQNALQS